VETSGTRRAAGLLAVAGVAVLLAAVALASRPETGTGLPPLGAEPLRVVLDAAVYLVLAAAVLSLAVIVWALWPRAGEALPALPPRRRHSALAMAVGTALAVVLVTWLRRRGLVVPWLDQAASMPAPAAGAPPSASPVPAPAAGGVDWIAIAIVLGLVLAAAALAWRALRPSRPRPGSAAAVGLRAVLDDAIEDVLGEADPRRAVIAAWARLERVLARGGLPRRDSEAPLEYAERAGAELEVGVSLERLADLFEWARFSRHEVTPAMREEALAGLRAVRDGLRRAS
jgi:hypothetical protein